MLLLVADLHWNGTPDRNVLSGGANLSGLDSDLGLIDVRKLCAACVPSIMCSFIISGLKVFCVIIIVLVWGTNWLI